MNDDTMNTGDGSEKGLAHHNAAICGMPTI